MVDGEVGIDCIAFASASFGLLLLILYSVRALIGVMPPASSG